MSFIEVIDFFLPRLCFACNSKLNPREECVCSVCLLKFETAEKVRINSEYNRKFRNKGLIADFQSMYVFQKQKEFQQLIHSLKYGRKFRAGIFLGEKLGNHFMDILTGWGVEIIIPVPLHRLKKTERGYNQSSYIAKGLSKCLKIPVDEKVIYRIKNTISQTGLNLSEREENIKDAFKVKHPEKIRGKTILLVDDVITTGATINECAGVLKKSGAAGIYALSSAVAD